MVKNQQQLMESFQDFEPARVKRNGQAYVETSEYIIPELQRQLEMYQSLEQTNQRGRLIRDQIDNLIRRYHEYVVAGRYVAHYRQAGCMKKDGNVFEHVIPLRTVRNMLSQGTMTIQQALNSPTCLISPEKNVLLGELKLTKSSPNAWFFWQRYNALGLDIETWDGTPVDQTTWDFAKHCEYFGIKS